MHWEKNAAEYNLKFHPQIKFVKSLNSVKHGFLKNTSVFIWKLRLLGQDISQGNAERGELGVDQPREQKSLGIPYCSLQLLKGGL